MTMSLDRLIESAENQKSAIIDEIELAPKELFELIREIELTEERKVRQRIKRKFKVMSDDNSANIFDFFALNNDFVDNWKKRVYTVTYREVNLRLVDNIRHPL